MVTSKTGALVVPMDSVIKGVISYHCAKEQGCSNGKGPGAGGYNERVDINGWRIGM